MDKKSVASAAAALNAKILNHTQSIKLVKNLFRVAFSTIAFIRHFFDDSCFKNKRYGDYIFKVIRKSNNPKAAQYISWLEQGVFDALRRGYLSDVLLEVYENPEQRHCYNNATLCGASGSGSSSSKCIDLDKENTKGKLLEVYALSIVYADAEVLFSVSDQKRGLSDDRFKALNIKRSSTELLRTLLSMTQTIKPLPRSRVISIRLLYTHNTPPGYEPPLFRPAGATDTFGLDWFESMNDSNKSSKEYQCVGRVKTPFHELKVGVFSAPSRMSYTPVIPITAEATSCEQSVSNGNLLESEINDMAISEQRGRPTEGDDDASQHENRSGDIDYNERDGELDGCQRSQASSYVMRDTQDIDDSVTTGEMSLSTSASDQVAASSSEKRKRKGGTENQRNSNFKMRRKNSVVKDAMYDTQ